MKILIVNIAKNIFEKINKNFKQMKKTFKAMAIMAIAVTISLSAAAQQGDKAVGGNLVVGMGDSWTNIGLGAKFLYNVTDPIRLAGEFDYFFKKDYVSWWDFSVYGHYLFPVATQVSLYPSLGLGMVGAKSDFGGSYSEFAFSLGGGVDYALSSNLSLNGELRIKLYDGYNRTNLAIGLSYKF